MVEVRSNWAIKKQTARRNLRNCMVAIPVCFAAVWIGMKCDLRLFVGLGWLFAAGALFSALFIHLPALLSQKEQLPKRCSVSEGHLAFEGFPGEALNLWLALHKIKTLKREGDEIIVVLDDTRWPKKIRLRNEFSTDEVDAFVKKVQELIAVQRT